MFDSVLLGVNDVMNLCDRILIMPMDLPAILEETLKKVLSIDSELVRTTFNGQPGHPIIVSNEFAKSLVNYSGVDGLRGAMENYDSPITNVEVDDEAVYFDIDTPEEYHELIEWNYRRGNGYPVGGTGGGGSSLTREGIRLVENYSKLMSEMRQEMEKKYKKYFAMGLRV